MKNAILIFGFIGFNLLIAFLYREAFSGYFFQDDWFTLSISRARTVKEFLVFFWPRSDVIYYRPLGMQFFFFIMQQFFSLNSTMFHIAAFLFHSVNIFLTWKILQTILRRPNVAFLVSFMYGLATLHFIPFYWPSTFPFVLGPTFYLLSFFYYIVQMKKRSIFFFILGLLTNEILCTLPLVLIFYELIIARTKQRVYLLWYFILLAPYFIVRFSLAKVPFIDSYSPSISNFAATIRAYVLWSLNWPEEISKQFVSPLRIQPSFVKDFFNMTFVLSVTSIALFAIMFVGLVLLFKQNIVKRTESSQLSFRLIIFSLALFFTVLSPLLFFPKHIFPYYLAIPSLGLFIIIAIAAYEVDKVLFLYSRVHSITTILVGALWFISSFHTIQFSKLTHWASKRSRITQVVLGELKRQAPSLPVNTTILMPRDELLKITFNDQLAIRLLYNNSTIFTHYSEGKDEEREKFIPKNDQELIERYPLRIIFSEGGKK